ncbi:MAG: UDP-N-acetylmuramoyl-L-alanyl-D-glutamate--2,6-diaminopimelate ligase [Alphaproteobacteria bacterium]|nr:UDP-N-acetylmuramoyl-L-alanyl-D-glutamate--2,6-diaminopimelate ligase [Alphaproteobacteria bacterium]
MDEPASLSVKRFAGLASDSRNVRPGFLFAALSGTRQDGADFIRDAVANGAIAVLGDREAAAAARAFGAEFIEDENPRARLARLAAEFFGAQPRIIAAVTGTNGKTSVVTFLREIWTALGHPAASVGTVGVVAPGRTQELSHTTPDPIELHRLLAALKSEGIDHAALEASSHGLAQCRMDGVEVGAAAFTNITRDHLDYHATFEDYLAAKLRLFAVVLRAGGTAVVNADSSHASDFEASARKRGITPITVGEAGETLKVLSLRAEESSQVLELSCGREIRKLRLPLVGTFQASNALVAAGLAIGLGEPVSQVLDALETLKGAPGRLERVARSRSGAPIYVDYAHTPDALETVLKVLRPHVAGKLHLVFGCGGDRDRGKRPLMGQAACRFADVIIVTDDNPRSEDPSQIRREILKTCGAAREIGDRREAIRTAIDALAEHDALIVAGKGHETGQIIGSKRWDFSDRDEVLHAVRSTGGSET